MARVASVLVALTLLLFGLSPAAPAAVTPRVGVLNSASSLAFAATKGLDIAGRQQAAYDTLQRVGLSPTWVSDADLENPSRLADFDVIVLPYTRVMNAAASLAVRDWVAAGGGLVPVLAAPREYPLPGGWGSWPLALNNEAWEWGPLSEAYQMDFINDPTPNEFSLVSDPTAPSHPILSATLGNLGLSSLQLDRPSAAGAEFGLANSPNVQTLLRFHITNPGSVEGVDVTQYDNYPAAEATRYGYGKIVYFDASIIDFFPEYSYSLSHQTYGGVLEGDIATELLRQSVLWAGSWDGVYGAIIRTAKTWGEIDAWGSSIYVRQHLANTGNVPVTGTTTVRIFNPSGGLEYSKSYYIIGLAAGQTYMYNFGWEKGGVLDTGSYRVEVEYKFTYPNYSETWKEYALVHRSQGQNLPTTRIGVFRASGQTRYGTAAAISERFFGPGVSKVYIATGETFPDALAAGAVAGHNGSPILLTLRDALPGETAAELRRLNPASIVIVGGTSAVSTAVAADLANYTSGAVTRLSGSDRYATAAALSASSFSPGVPAAFVVTGESFPDGLAAGPAAAAVGGPVLLVTATSIPGSTKAELQRLNPQRIYIVGGTGVISAGVQTSLGAYTSGPVERLAGSDRYTTAVEVSKRFFPAGAQSVFMATGASFPDALAAGPAAALAGGPLLLTHRDAIDSGVQTELSRLTPDVIAIAGGPGVVSNTVQQTLWSWTP